MAMDMDPHAALGMPELRHVRREAGGRDGRRSLESNDDYESLLVDANGNKYDPDRLAWRYLGIYKDCSDDGEDDEGGDDDRR